MRPSRASSDAHTPIALSITAAAVLLIVIVARIALQRTPSAPIANILIALGGSTVFAWAAWSLRGVDLSGAAAGWVIALTLWLAAGWRGFTVLLVVFVVTWAATRFGYARKQSIGVAERRGGRRNAAQVMANVGAAAAFAAFEPAGWTIAAIAVLCEAAADTVSSELGQVAGGRPRMITTLRAVEPGTDGAVSLVGTVAGAAAAVGVAAVACILGLLPPVPAALAAVGGIAGMFLDSVLGATLEQQGTLGNNGVNGISTIAAGLLAWLTALAMR